MAAVMYGTPEQQLTRALALQRRDAELMQIENQLLEDYIAQVCCCIPRARLHACCHFCSTPIQPIAGRTAGYLDAKPWSMQGEVATATGASCHGSNSAITFQSQALHVCSPGYELVSTSR